MKNYGRVARLHGRFGINMINYFIIFIFIAGAMCGPFISHYAKYNSIKIHERDIDDNRKLVEEGKEPMELPEGYNFFSKGTMPFIIISWIAGLMLCIIYSFTGSNINFLLYGVVSLILLAISIVDFQVYEIPIECNVLILVVGIINLIFDLKNYLLYLLGFGAVSVIFLLLAVISKGKAMGGGDIKLMATLGLLLGWKKILLVMILGCILGTVIHGIAMMFMKKSKVLAFGPYLSLAAVVAMCYGEKLIDLYLSIAIPNLK